jgi:hypothetical protein
VCTLCNFTRNTNVCVISLVLGEEAESVSTNTNSRRGSSGLISMPRIGRSDLTWAFQSQGKYRCTCMLRCATWRLNCIGVRIMPFAKKSSFGTCYILTGFHVSYIHTGFKPLIGHPRLLTQHILGTLLIWNRDISVDIATLLRGLIPGRGKFILFSTVFWPTQSLIQWVPWTLSLGVKQSEHEADLSHPTNAQFKNGGVIPSLPIRLYGVVLTLSSLSVLNLKKRRPVRSGFKVNAAILNSLLAIPEMEACCPKRLVDFQQTTWQYVTKKTDFNYRN